MIPKGMLSKISAFSTSWELPFHIIILVSLSTSRFKIPSLFYILCINIVHFGCFSVKNRMKARLCKKGLRVCFHRIIYMNGSRKACFPLKALAQLGASLGATNEKQQENSLKKILDKHKLPKTDHSFHSCIKWNKWLT